MMLRAPFRPAFAGLLEWRVNFADICARARIAISNGNSLSLSLSRSFSSTCTKLLLYHPAMGMSIARAYAISPLTRVRVAHDFCPRFLPLFSRSLSRIADFILKMDIREYQWDLESL